MLHASAIDIGSTAIAFAGTSGAGKSTLAASFASAGHRFLSDDGLALEWTGSEYLAVPSHSSIRLCSDSHGVITGRKRPRSAAKDKRRLAADENLRFCDETRPLAAVFMLGRKRVTQVEITQLHARDALPQLAANAFFLSSGEPALLEAHFEHLCRVAQMGAAYTLDYPRSYSYLPEVRRVVIEQFGSGSPAFAAGQHRNGH